MPDAEAPRGTAADARTRRVGIVVAAAVLLVVIASGAWVAWSVARKPLGGAPLVVRLERADGATRIRIGDDVIGAVGDDAAIARLAKDCGAWAEAVRAAGGPESRARVAADPEVPTGEIVRVVQAMLGARVDKVDFDARGR